VTRSFQHVSTLKTSLGYLEFDWNTYLLGHKISFFGSAASEAGTYLSFSIL